MLQIRWRPKNAVKKEKVEPAAIWAGSPGNIITTSSEVITNLSAASQMLLTGRPML
jgi:hypothetical protein